MKSWREKLARKLCGSMTRISFWRLLSHWLNSRWIGALSAGVCGLNFHLACDPQCREKYFSTFVRKSFTAREMNLLSWSTQLWSDVDVSRWSDFNPHIIFSLKPLNLSSLMSRVPLLRAWCETFLDCCSDCRLRVMTLTASSCGNFSDTERKSLKVSLFVVYEHLSC